MSPWLRTLEPDTTPRELEPQRRTCSDRCPPWRSYARSASLRARSGPQPCRQHLQQRIRQLLLVHRRGGPAPARPTWAECRWPPAIAPATGTAHGADGVGRRGQSSRTSALPRSGRRRPTAAAPAPPTLTRAGPPRCCVPLRVAAANPRDGRCSRRARNAAKSPVDRARLTAVSMAAGMSLSSSRLPTAASMTDSASALGSKAAAGGGRHGQGRRPAASRDGSGS